MRYPCAFAAIGVAAALQEVLFGGGPAHPYLLFFVATLLSAVMIGRGPAALAAVLGCLIVSWRKTAEPDGSEATVALAAVAFLAICAAAIAAVETARQVFRALAQARSRAEAGEREKEILLVELGHRIKNDLQRVAAVLLVQASTAPNHASACELRAAAARVRVLGRLHDRLSRRDGEGSVDTRNLLGALADDLRSSCGGALASVTLLAETESHTLPLPVAASVGLIANELVTNALKHAFPAGKGQIRIGFRLDADRYVLEVADDGVALVAATQEKIAGEQGSGRGRMLAGALARQLGGRLDVRSGGERGTVAVLAFPVARLQDKADG
nr:histidine kinase dimerization/phosphoacceptor domain -containing protein [Falsiroseomonas tokyonensis]